MSRPPYHPRFDPARGLTTALATLAVVATALLPARGQNATRNEPPPAQGVELLGVAPFDRLTLTDNTVVSIEPVEPRPLPPYDAAKEAQKRRARHEVPAEGNIALPGKPQKKIEAAREGEDDEAEKLTVHLLKGEVRDYVLKRSSVKSVEYFEDMLLAEANRLTLARDYTRAFECLLRVRARDPKWRGLDEQVNRLLFAEGSAALLDGDAERGLRLLGELWSRDRNFPGLADKLAASYGGRALRAFELGLYALGRTILHDAEPLAPAHAQLRLVREKFVAKAKALAGSAEKAEGAARVDLLAEALRVWPALEGADAAYRSAFAAAPTLEVAVDDVPRGLGPWVRSPADARVVRLLYLPALARDDEASAAGKAPGQLAAKLASTDLGRRLVVELRPGVGWSDGSRPVAAIDLARALTDMAEPTSGGFLARWADLLDRVETPDETHVEIRLTRAALRPGAWLTGPVGPAHAGGDGRVATIDRGRELVVDGSFRWAPAGADRAELTARDGPEPRPKIRRVKEIRYPNARQTLGAFERGEVAAVAHVPPDRVAAVVKWPGVRIGRYARPAPHRIALDGRNPVLRNRSLRRGLSYAIDRKALLEETLLRRAADDANRPSDGLFLKGDYADAPDVAPLAYDPLLARMLIAAGRKELGGRPIKLTLEYPATPEAQAVAPRIAEAFTKAGAEVVAVEKPESVLESELRSGRRFDLAYRACGYDEPVSDAGPLIAPAYDAPPSADPLASVASPRILQLLLQLERAPEYPTARGLVVQIDRECRDELPVLPLWQLEDHYAWHERVTGPKDVADSLYDGVAGWEVAPWYARDPW